MKTKFVIKAFAVLCTLSLVLSGCTRSSKPESVNSEEHSDTSVDSDITENNQNPPGGDSTDSSDLTDNPYFKDYPSEKIFETSIESNGINLTDKVGDKNLFLVEMDNNYLYFANNEFPVTYTGVSRNDFSKSEVMTYDVKVEDLDSNNHTYSGSYFATPCFGDPYGTVYLKVLVGKVGEQYKCILNKEVGTTISVNFAEISDTEVVFMCDSDRKDGLMKELYKYKIGDEQANLIYTQEVASKQLPSVNFYDGEIYIVHNMYSESGLQSVSNRNDGLFCIQRLNANGEEIDREIIELPGFTRVSIADFTVTENNYIMKFRFPSTNETQGYYKTVIIDRKTRELFSVFNFGSRLNDARIDNRYILFGYNVSSESGPQICVFDSEKSEFHTLSFKSLKDFNVWHIVADCKGDVVFVIMDDKEDINVKTDTFSLVLFEDVCSILTNDR